MTDELIKSTFFFPAYSGCIRGEQSAFTTFQNLNLSGKKKARSLIVSRVRGAKRGTQDGRRWRFLRAKISLSGRASSNGNGNYAN